jgi:kumamolisin
MALRKKANTGPKSRHSATASRRKTKIGAAKRGETAQAKVLAEKSHVVLDGSHRPRKKGATRLKDANPRWKVEVTITLRGPKLPGGNQLGGRALSAAEFKTKCSASKRDADKVSQVLQKLDLKIERTSLETRSMIVKGTVARMEAAFHPRLGVYQSADQGKFRDREGDYKIPKELKKIVTAVIGFGERRVATRKSARHGAGLGEFGPADVEGFYRFPPGDAAGQKIAIAELGGAYFASDLAAYCAKFKRPKPKVKIISINTPVHTLKQVRRLARREQSQEIDDAGEVMMDVEIIAGLCPAAAISVYFAKSDQKGWIDLLNRVILDRPVVASISWGSAESSGDWSKAALIAINERLHAAAALGITICGAAGDDGTGDEETDGDAHVDFPSCSPFVLAVGGTMLNKENGRLTERVWWESPGWRTNQGGGSTGGGVSSFFRRPPWQKFRIKSLNAKKFDGRVVPDIAALAGPPGFYTVFEGRNSYGAGTSASAPVWAALIARINALLPSHKRQRYLTPLLYRRWSTGLALGSIVCRDVTAGHNTSNPKPGFGYEATKGFDAVSGWGTPIGTALLLALT